MSRHATFARALARAREASWAELLFAARAWACALPVELSLRTIGLERTVRWIERAPRPARPWRGAVTVAQGATWVSRAYRLHALPDGCLRRSLVQYLLHRCDGVDSRFVVGVRRDGGFAAHAWVEPLDSRTTAQHFTPLYDTRGQA